MLEQELEIYNEEQMKALAIKFANLISPGDIITLTGDLGVGKTTFVKYLIKSIVGDKEEVTSPTFNLVHIFEGKKYNIWHFDLYRLEDKNDAYELGIEDAFNEGVSLIEWPGIIDDIIPKDRLDMVISFGQEANSRILKFIFPVHWQKRIELITNQYFTEMKIC